MSFRTAEPALKEALDGIAKGNAQSSDFQVGWVWDESGNVNRGRDSEETTKVFGGASAV